MVKGPVRAVGMVWYRREDYAEILRIMDDADKLPPTWEKWHYAADRGLREVEGKGHIVIRAYIDPVEFSTWCVARGLKLDAEAREKGGRGKKSKNDTENLGFSRIWRPCRRRVPIWHWAAAPPGAEPASPAAGSRRGRRAARRGTQYANECVDREVGKTH
jgi:hypothetical protein